jgi:hypothetical protein
MNEAIFNDENRHIIQQKKIIQFSKFILYSLYFRDERYSYYDINDITV